MGLFREFHGMQPIFNGKLYSIHLRYLDSMWLNAVFMFHGTSWRLNNALIHGNVYRKGLVHV